MNPIVFARKVLKMKSSLGIFFALAVICTVCSGLATPIDQNAVIPAARQQLDLFVNSRKLIEELVTNLRQSAGEAINAIVIFSRGVQEEADLVRERIANDIEKLRNRVSEAMDTITNRLIDSGVAVVDCIATHRGDANAVFNSTFSKTMNCVDERIAEVSEQIKGLSTMANGAVEFSNKALDDMKHCTDESGNFLSTGSCLGSVAVQAEMKAVVFGAQSALSIARINLSVATLPATLQMCAASRLVESGMATARLIMDIGTCSASSIYSTMTGQALLARSFNQVI